MSIEDARRMVEQIPGWQLNEPPAGEGAQPRPPMLVRTFRFKDFAQAMGFVNRVAEIAEAEGHHPEIHISWNRVRLELTTHAIKGLSENDFIMAAKISEASS
jgi:4a-hydroxytetrahydrobiopterin dehydratase